MTAQCSYYSIFCNNNLIFNQFKNNGVGILQQLTVEEKPSNKQDNRQTLVCKETQDVVSVQRTKSVLSKTFVTRFKKRDAWEGWRT